MTAYGPFTLITGLRWPQGSPGEYENAASLSGRGIFYRAMQRVHRTRIDLTRYAAAIASRALASAALCASGPRFRPSA